MTSPGRFEANSPLASMARGAVSESSSQLPPGRSENLVASWGGALIPVVGTFTFISQNENPTTQVRQTLSRTGDGTR